MALLFYFSRQPTDFRPHLVNISKSLTCFPSTMSTPELAQVQQAWARILPHSPIYAFLLDTIHIHSASPGLIQARILVTDRHLNSKGTLHGSFSACVVDWAGGLAIAACGLESTGVSTDIHVSYLSTATKGDWLEIEGRANKVGKSLAFTTVTISKIVPVVGPSKTEEASATSVPAPAGAADAVVLVAQGSHTKYVRTRSK